MGRAQRKTPHRDPGDWVANLVSDLIPGAQLAGDGQDAGQRREEGIGEPRDIPGGKNHQANPATKAEPGVKKNAAWRYSRADLAHGVPPDEAGYYERDPRLAGTQHGGHVHLRHETDLPSPVPVYIVEGEGGARTIRRVAARSITVPASTAAEPARVCSRNPARVEVRLLNEDTATDIRWSETLSALSAGTGALLPWPSNSYLTVPGQGEIFAIGATGAGTPRLSIVEIYEQEAG